jgi:Tol biopolymer transport system component
VRRVAWLGNGTGLVINATDEPFGFFQLWFVAYPGGDLGIITDGLNDYRTVSLAADPDTLVTVKSEQMMNVWVVPNAEGLAARKVTTELGQYFGVSWFPDGRLVYSSLVSGNPDIWITDAAGQGQRQLTFKSRGNYYPTVSADSRYIVFASNRRGYFNIWRMDADGGNQTQLTHGDNEFYPNCSPDGRWVFYQVLASGTPTLWKVPIDGGQPLALTNYYAGRPVVSPDGKFTSSPNWDEQAKAWRLAIISSEGGPPLKLFDIPVRYGQGVRWLPDNRTLVYLDARGGYNLWAMPLDGGTARQLTDLKSDRIFDFDLSRDGRQFALTRGTIVSDVVQIRNLR